MNAQMLDESAQMDAKSRTNVGVDAQMHTPPSCKEGGCSAQVSSICAEAFVQTVEELAEQQAIDLAYCKTVACELRARFGSGVKLYATNDLNRIPYSLDRANDDPRGTSTRSSK